MRYNWLWPNVSDKGSARKAIQEGIAACGFMAAVDMGVAIYANASHQAFRGYGAAIWVDGALFALLGIGLWKNSRIAAVLALSLMLLEIADKLLHHTGTFNLVTIALLLAIVNAVRGAFAFHKHNNQNNMIGTATTARPIG